MSKNDIVKFMKKAIRLSIANVEKGNGGPFGAVIVKDGKVIARGVNNVTSTNDPTAHAEVVAIRDACKNLDTFQLDNCEVYTTCEPCPMCLGAIYWARPKIIYYANNREDAATIGFDDSMIYQEMSANLDERKIPIVCLGREQAIKIFEEWKAKEDKTSY